MRATTILVALAAAGSCIAQIPDLIVTVDARPTFRIGDTKDIQLRWFDLDGRPSVVGFKALLQDGNRLVVTQRLARYPGNGDNDPLDEYYLEAPGDWRLGKQVLPFGQKTLYREAAVAARARTHLVFDAVPIDIAACDSGAGRPRGVIGRIGENTGLSFAFGNNFAVSDSAFAAIREDLHGAGANRGYQFLLGFDTVYFTYPVTVEFEAMALRQGETPADSDEEYADLRVWYAIPESSARLGFAYGHRFADRLDSFRFQGEFPIADQVLIMPFVRLGSPGLRQIGTTVRFRL